MVANAPPTIKNGRRRTFRAAHAHSPGRERVKNRSTPVAGELLSHAAKPSFPQNSDEIALVGDDTGLPDDGPEHQAQSNGGHGQRHPKMGLGYWLIQTAKRLNHPSSRRAPYKSRAVGSRVPGRERRIDYLVAARHVSYGKSGATLWKAG